MAHPRTTINPKNIPDVVIKLGLSPISPEESSLFRRLTYEQLHASDVAGGPVSALQGHAVLLALGVSGQDSAVQDVVLENYSIALIYTDKDGDKTLICTNGDLFAALKEYQPEGKLKILAQVKPSHETASLSSSRATQTNPPRTVTVSTNTAPLVVNDAGTPVTASSSDGSDSRVPEEQSAAPTIVHDTQASSQVVAAETPMEQGTPATETETPPFIFIHGRHTCDGCLTTPIIGKRFHAINLDDYDLCESCRNKYTGDVLKFEVVELDIDRPFQDRWHHRQSRMGAWNRHKPWHHVANACMDMERRKWAKGRRGRCHGHGGRCEQRPGGFQPSSSFHGSSFHPNGPRPEESNSGDETRSSFHSSFFLPNGSLAEESNSGDLIDLALKEAIRRSLLDLSTAPVEGTPDKREDQDVKTGNVQQNGGDNGNDESGAAESGRPNAVCNAHSKESVDESQPSPTPVGKSSEAALSEHTSLVNDDNYKANDDSRTVNREASFSSFSSAVGRTEEETVEVKPSSSNEANGPASPNSKNSFAVDAEGIGDVATALGETLDRFADLIDSIELDHSRMGWSAVSEVANDVGSTDDNANDVAKANDQSEVLEAGAAIVDGEEQDDPKEADEDDHDSWQVVTEDQQIAYDESLARAAQLIGSALFNSDMARSGEVESQVSSISSVPTTIPSVSLEPAAGVPAVQLERWAIQLNQLHELGFQNDLTNVDVLERLNAANIGSDLNEEISVQQVVNEIVKDW